MKKFFEGIWTEICLGYAAIKKFVVQVLGIFKDPSGKVSSKRVVAVGLVLFSCVQLIKGDHMAFLAGLLASLVILIVQAFSKT